MYSAIIIEPREHPALSFVLDNFIHNLSDEWNFIIFHGNLNLSFINNIIETTNKRSVYIECQCKNQTKNCMLLFINHKWHTWPLLKKPPKSTLFQIQTALSPYRLNAF